MSRPRKEVQNPNGCDYCHKILVRKVDINGAPERACQFVKRRHCDKRCVALARKRPKTSKSAGWAEARALTPEGPCELCGAPDALDVHHRDENPLNNAPENRMRVCRSCHRKEHR